ncbi:MAG: MBOAT family O-acyltransferase [Flavobacteriales bacterium]|nr:MBOAT family O-acyltransferase [Flavobacteriales bacterium]
MSWKAEYIILIVASTLVDFCAGLAIENADSKKRKKLWLFLSLFVNLGLLFTFKYWDFFNESIRDTLNLFSIQFDPSTLKLLLPVGISFYTFQTLSYTIDIYYGKIKPIKHIGIFATYVSFFPQLVAGPIERAKHLIPQFYNKVTFEYERVKNGLLLMLWGFFVKIVIADRLAILVNTVYKHDDANNYLLDYTGASLFIASFFFMFQLYLDFSAYSNIAIGAARVLGFDLQSNFRRPYWATSISDFWHRWHISLSTWFRDYVYIPLGGNKRGVKRHLINLLITFLLSGLWHGASWNFALWGLLNGLFLIVQVFIDRKKTSKKPKTYFIKRLFQSLVIMLLWGGSLIFFRAQTFDDAMYVFQNISLTGWNNLYELGLTVSEFKFVFYCLVGIYILDYIQEKQDLYKFLADRNIVIRFAVYIAAILMIIYLGAYGEDVSDNQFLYFQF